jgi:hypothetical protein
MGKAISNFFSSFSERNLAVRQVSDYVEFSQHEKFFHLAALKSERAARLKNHFASCGVRKIYLSSNISGFDFELPGRNVSVLEKGFFHETDPGEIAKKCTHLEDSVVILNNNDVGHNGGLPLFADFFSRCDKTIFAVWDWDNHHWMDVSIFLAVHSDLYIPVQHENLYVLSRFNWRTAGPIYAGSVQWSKKFLKDHLPDIFETKRSDAPLGKHIPYAPFRFRNQVISTLSRYYPTIGFSDRTFHVRTPEDRFVEWCSHKAHWIVPVLNDIPIRIFDALITGGIPIVPESLRFLPPVDVISRRHIVFYTPQDVVNPTSVVERAITLFDEGGNELMLERHNYALGNHQGDVCIRQILGYVNEAFELGIMP